MASAISQLSAAAARLGLEALAVVRGGGGIEDLAAFNSEGVARAIAACSVPVVTGIGHEIDTTIADLVADRRAKTPTDAANVLVPDRRELRRELAHSWERLGESADRLMSELEVELDDLRGRALQSGPASKLGVLEREIASLARLLTGAAAQRPERFGGELERLRGRLQSSSPRLLVAEWQRRLEASHGALRAGARAGLAAAETRSPARPAASRGFSRRDPRPRLLLARKVGESGLLVDARQVAVGDRIETRLSRGSLVSRIEAAHADGEVP